MRRHRRSDPPRTLQRRRQRRTAVRQGMPCRTPRSAGRSLADPRKLRRRSLRPSCKRTCRRRRRPPPDRPDRIRRSAGCWCPYSRSCRRRRCARRDRHSGPPCRSGRPDSWCHRLRSAGHLPGDPHTLPRRRRAAERTWCCSFPRCIPGRSGKPAGTPRSWRDRSPDSHRRPGSPPVPGGNRSCRPDTRDRQDSAARRRRSCPCRRRGSRTPRTRRSRSLDNRTEVRRRPLSRRPSQERQPAGHRSDWRHPATAPDSPAWHQGHPRRPSGTPGRPTA
jgi:hypothetical protein